MAAFGLEPGKYSPLGIFVQVAVYLAIGAAVQAVLSGSIIPQSLLGWLIILGWSIPLVPIMLIYSLLVRGAK